MSCGSQSIDAVVAVPCAGHGGQAVSCVGYEVTKRMIDVVGSLVGLVFLAPVFALIAVLIKITDRGPVLFVQTRVGKDGRHFKFCKFRSMVPDAEQRKTSLKAASQHDDPRTFKVVTDPRVTWIGQILRRTSLDELPQIWNVLQGDMSLVGPRPPVPSEVALYSDRDRQRLAVKPGLTCIWQVNGRGDLPFPEQLELDLKYIRSRGLWLDTKLLALTIPAVLSCKGAY